MRVALVGAELEENLGLRYMASTLERSGHEAEIIAFNSRNDIPRAVKQINAYNPEITGLSMVFTSRSREFCSLAQALREDGYRGHIIAGGHFASLNCERLLQDFPAFDSVGLGEGEDLICALADRLKDIHDIPGICYRRPDGTAAMNPSTGNPENLDALPFPKRMTFHTYFERPIASILSSRGCWRDCAFCSINAWYKRGGGKKFRVRSVENIVEEMKELYFSHGVRIFNFQDDNFFLPSRTKAVQRFKKLRDLLQKAGIKDIAIAVKARPDSITDESVGILDELGLFRVFLGVENASRNGLSNLNRKCTLDMILNALRLLNDFDVHIAYNILMFEPDTTMDDIMINLRFMERHMDNPFNFCRAEAYAGTGLENKLLAEKRLLGDYFGFDYRLKNARPEAFHQIANYAFFDRNFSESGLHYFNMQVDFYSNLLRRFHPDALTQGLRSMVRNFIKQTNMDTYESLCRIYDFTSVVKPDDHVVIRAFAREMRDRVDERSRELRVQGERILRWLNDAYEGRNRSLNIPKPGPVIAGLSYQGCGPVPYRGLASLKELDADIFQAGLIDSGRFGIASSPVPYCNFKDQLLHMREERG